MSHSIKTCAASLALVASFAALAADAPPATPVAPSDAAVVQPLGQMAVRESNGTLRAPTAAEASALHTAAAKGLRAVAREPQTITRQHRSGATGVRLTEEFMSYAVVVKQPDGRLVEYCFQGREAAEAALAAPQPAPVNNSLPTE